MLIDYGGDVVMHSNPSLIGAYIDNIDIVVAIKDYYDGQTAKKSGSGVGNILGTEQVYGYYILDDNTIVCVSQQTDEVIYNFFPREDGYIVALFGIITLLIFIPMLHHRIVVPMMRLKESINLASVGKYQTCEVKYDDEIGALVRGFNHLTEQIRERIGELELKNRALRVLEMELKSDKERLKVSEQRFKSAVDISTIAIFEISPYTTEFFASNSWEKITTYDISKADGYPLEYVMNTIICPEYREKIITWVDQMSGCYDEDIRIFTSDGKTKWLHITMAVLDDEKTGWKKISGTITDINERMTAQEFSDYIAHHEALTGFPRRSMFCDEVGQKLREIKDGYWGAVLVLNIANMRRINDTFGFSIGDRVILVAAEALKKAFGKEMYYSRNSGDSSFLLYVECRHDVDHLDQLSARIQDMFRKPLLIQNMSIMAEIRMGAALYPLHGYEVDELIQYADIAMIEAWYVKKTYFALFERNMVAKIRRTHQIMQILQDIDEIKSLYLVYQPIVNIEGRCVGFEALARLNITSMGFISPAEFIPLAENARIIVSMGKELLYTACNKAVELVNKGVDFEYISVNVSPVQLDDDNFVNSVFNILKETGLPPKKLQLEVTESVMLSNVDVICEKLRVFREGGITIALDDFGTGYSSMKYLRTIPLDVLKIDKHFIDEIENDKQQVFAFMMIQMAHKLGLKVVAEGVETKTQFDILVERDCDCIQGYYISRPLGEDALEVFLKEH
jgi:diguanylate cyclase (GGDEF)-like protein/PAS domain S-box-containing protein